jgi:hypothetical protein
VKTDQITTRHVESTSQKWYFRLLTAMLARKVNGRMFQHHEGTTWARTSKCEPVGDNKKRRRPGPPSFAWSIRSSQIQAIFFLQKFSQELTDKQVVSLSRNDNAVLMDIAGARIDQSTVIVRKLLIGQLPTYLY